MSIELDALDDLLKIVSLQEARHVTMYEVTRMMRHGGIESIRVEIHDSGRHAPMPSLRYSVVAKTRDGKAATGNPGATIHSALAQVHWGDLDGK